MSDQVWQPFLLQIHFLCVYVCSFFLLKINLFFWLKDNFALQFCVAFCHTPAWVSHRYIYVPSLLNLPPTSCPFPPLKVVTEPQFEFPESYSKFPLALYFTYGNVNFHVTLSIHLALSFLPTLSLWIFPEHWLWVSFFMHWTCPGHLFYIW